MHSCKCNIDVKCIECNKKYFWNHCNISQNMINHELTETHKRSMRGNLPRLSKRKDCLIVNWKVDWKKNSRTFKYKTYGSFEKTLDKMMGYINEYLSGRYEKVGNW